MSEQICKTVQALLALRPADRSAVEQRLVDAHLLTCTRCAEWARACAGQDQLLAQAAPPPRLTAFQRARFFSRLQHERRWSEMSKKWGVVFKTMAGVAAIVALIFVLDLVFSQMSERKLAQPGGIEATATGVEATATGVEATATEVEPTAIEVEATATEPVAAATSTPEPTATTALLATPGPPIRVYDNLLVNGGFEDAFTQLDEYNYVSDGWTLWYDDALAQPVWKVLQLPAEKGFPDIEARVHGGQRSVQWFTSATQHRGGIWQRVAVPGAEFVALNVWVQIVSADGKSQVNGIMVSDPDSLGSYQVQCGIDPLGQIPGEMQTTPPDSVVWSEPIWDADTRSAEGGMLWAEGKLLWAQCEVSTAVQSDHVTVWVMGQNELPLFLSTAFIDDAHLAIIPILFQVAQRLIVEPVRVSQPLLTPTPPPPPVTPAPTPMVEPVEIAHMAVGVESQALIGPQPVIETVVDLGMGWYKQQVSWAEIEPLKGQYAWAQLDALVEAADEAGIKLLFSIIDAPLWTHPDSEGRTPPDDVQDMVAFAGALAERYRGRVQAYEIWPEQNLKYGWEAAPLNGAAYVELLRAAFHALKAADPDALVVSGGLVPTEINDGVWAVDSLVYLQQMYDAGLQDVCDVVGVHALGYANPPDVYYPGGDFDPARMYDNHRSFFFRNTVVDMYMMVMAANGDGNKRIWITKFGWGTTDGLGMEAPQGYDFTADIDEQQQADYIVAAYTWAAQQGYVGGAFLYTVDVSPARSDAGLLYSITRPDGTPRPAYTAIQNMLAAQAGVAAPVEPIVDFVWPAAGAISSPFGSVTDQGGWHSGIDIAGEEGTSVVAADGGIVVWAGFATAREGYGNLIVIDHGNGFETLYAHLDQVGVEVGQPVAQGEAIGTRGQTGAATGPHLHFEIRKRGVRVDPLLYLP